MPVWTPSAPRENGRRAYFHEHETHREFFREHLVIKGTEVAKSCLAQLEVLARIGA